MFFACFWRNLLYYILQKLIILSCLNQDRYFLTEFAFNECVTICASGQNPSEVKWIMPGACTDNDSCLNNEYCNIYDEPAGNTDVSKGWGACRPCDPSKACIDHDISPFAWPNCETICEGTS